MRIFAAGAHKSFSDHLREIKKSNGSPQWRCFTTKVPRELYGDPYAQKILLNFVEENYKDFDVYEFAFYFLKTGHIFLLFQGRMKKACETFEAFLDFASEGEEHAKPDFELYDMGKQIGFVEDIFEDAMKEISQPQKSQKEDVKYEQKADGPEQRQEGVAAEKRDRNAERGMRLKPLLLLVEDERMTQSFIEALVGPYCDVIMADTITEGRKKYAQYWPNIVFMDIQLPDGDGKQLAQELCIRDQGAHIIMVSAYMSPEGVTQCKRAGAKGFVAKPVTSDKERLLAMIHSYNRERYSAMRQA